MGVLSPASYTSFSIEINKNAIQIVLIILASFGNQELSKFKFWIFKAKIEKRAPWSLVPYKLAHSQFREVP